MSVNVPTNSANPRCNRADRIGKNPRTRGGRRQIEGWQRTLRTPKLSLAFQLLRNERRPMSADILKRKLRNFPAANLNVRIAAAS